MSDRMRLIFRVSVGALPFRRYLHKRHGAVETLTAGNTVYVRPVFGLLKPDNRQPEVAQFRARRPKANRVRRRLSAKAQPSAR